MARHLITTVVPIELAPELSLVAAAGLRCGRLNVIEAGYIMTAANTIAAAESKVPAGVECLYEVPPYWRPKSQPQEDIPCVVLSLDEEIRREAAIACDLVGRCVSVSEAIRRRSSYCRDWMRYSLHDGCTDPILHV